MSTQHTKDRTVQTLRSLTSILGYAYGSSEICHFLYSIIKMHRPTTVVELGAGLGVSTFWMALALQENGSGHLWAVDNFVQYEEYRQKLFPRVQSALKEVGIALDLDHSPEAYFEKAEELLNLQAYWTLVHQTIDSRQPNHFETYPFAEENIDLLFSDFASDPDAILQLFVQILPRMAECSSVFIDSAPTIRESYFLLNSLVESFNAGNVPKILADLLTSEEIETILNRRYTLVHLTYNPEGHQSGTSWLKIEPHDIVPYPRVPFRS